MTVERPDPSKWQELWPEHATEIAEALDAIYAALNSLTVTTGDHMVEAAATQWAIEQLEEWIRAEIEADLILGHLFGPELDDEG